MLAYQGLFVLRGVCAYERFTVTKSLCRHLFYAGKNGKRNLWNAKEGNVNRGFLGSNRHYYIHIFFVFFFFLTRQNRRSVKFMLIPVFRHKKYYPRGFDLRERIAIMKTSTGMFWGLCENEFGDRVVKCELTSRLNCTNSYVSRRT